MDMLVSTDWLAAELDAPDLAVLDASLHLPAAQRDARAEFEGGHIPGAHFLDLAGLHDPASAMPGKVPDGARIARWLGDSFGHLWGFVRRTRATSNTHAQTQSPSTVLVCRAALRVIACEAYVMRHV